MAQEERPTLEFKLEYVLDGPGRDWNRNEVAKDLLALVNSAGRGADEAAHLILGAGDELRGDGTREAKDSKGRYARGIFLDILNARCTPPVHDLKYEEVELDGITYGVVTVMPSNSVHYLIKDLATPSKAQWRKNSVLIRRGDQIGVASPEEIQDLIRRREAAWRSGPEASHDRAPCYPGQLPASLPPKLKSDRKNILRDPSVSARLLRGEPPSLAESVIASRTVTVEVAQKNRPLGDWLPYNHFVAPSAVFSIRVADSGRLVHLGYTRATQPRDPGYRLTTGAAILWNASYHYDIAHEKDAPMDTWIQRLGDDRLAAIRMFASGAECTLLQILRYKIQFSGLDTICEPFAVITNDLRNPAGGRVYTQYVFHVTLAAGAPAQLSAMLSGIRVRRGGHVYVLAADFQGEELVGQDGQKNPMEYVAWEGLHNDKPTFTYETARFTRGFVIA